MQQPYFTPCPPSLFVEVEFKTGVERWPIVGYVPSADRGIVEPVVLSQHGATFRFTMLRDDPAVVSIKVALT
jgi:hypothetical protein